jgi:hypothetical protein
MEACLQNNGRVIVRCASRHLHRRQAQGRAWRRHRTRMWCQATQIFLEGLARVRRPLLRHRQRTCSWVPLALALVVPTHRNRRVRGQRRCRCEALLYCIIAPPPLASLATVLARAGRARQGGPGRGQGSRACEPS